MNISICYSYYVTFILYFTKLGKLMYILMRRSKRKHSKSIAWKVKSLRKKNKTSACEQSVPAESAGVLWDVSPEDTTATLSIGVPLDTDAAVAVGTAVRVPADAAIPDFFGATITLL